MKKLFIFHYLLSQLVVWFGVWPNQVDCTYGWNCWTSAGVQLVGLESLQKFCFLNWGQSHRYPPSERIAPVYQLTPSEIYWTVHQSCSSLFSQIWKHWRCLARRWMCLKIRQNLVHPSCSCSAGDYQVIPLGCFHKFLWKQNW